MKKYLWSYVLLLAVVLCSCTGCGPGGGNKEGSNGAEAVSIVFMGESIAAPTSYPDVPADYTPVLSDLYLYGELLRRCEVLDREGKGTQEIQQECEAVAETIRQRGYVVYPHGSIEGTSGYALVDLDGDKSPELLLLNNSSRDALRGQAPSITSVFTVRHGELVCLEADSYELQYNTILSADGTFYRCIDWQGTGYVNVSAFRLEAGRSEFTVVSDARSALSFSDSEVPESYWTKYENGKEIEIAEDEFYALLEQYSHPKKRMNLGFVPIHPDATDLSSVTRHDEGSSAPIEYPASYQGAPGEYRPILNDFYLVSKYMQRDELLDGDLESIGFMEYPYPSDAQLAYAVIDINNDKTPELLLGTVDGLKSSAPHSIFTLKDGKPVLLTSFWSRNYGVISADGTIYSIGSGGAAHTYLSSFRLDKNADALTQLTDIHSDYSDLEEKPYYVQVVDGRNRYIAERTFWDFYEEYGNLPETMELTIIPIAN
jgi:hypothetical protein